MKFAMPNPEPVLTRRQSGRRSGQNVKQPITDATPAEASTARGSKAARIARFIGELHPHSPLRITSWRFERARYLLENGLPLSRRLDDSFVKAARTFLAGQRRCHRRGDEARLAEQYPEVHAAWSISIGEPFLRCAIEARFLAREPCDQVAAKTACTPGEIQWYAKLFFDIESRLGNQGYILHRAIRLSPVPAERDEASVLRWLGYFGGPVVLDALLLGATGIPTPRTGEQAQAFIRDVTMATLHRKVSLAIFTMSSEGSAGRAIQRALQKLEETDRKRQKKEASAENVRSGIKVMVDDMTRVLQRPGDGARHTSGDEGGESGAV